MSTTPSEIWDDILKGNVGKDDPLWKEYLEKAAVFDTRMVDELNNIVDVLLVYVALSISVLSTFIVQTFTHLQRNPADITNDLLFAIYNQSAAQSSNTSIPPVYPRSYFFEQSEADYDAAFFQNTLLYTSLSLSIIVSVIALVAKLWLVSYRHQVFSVGSPYERAMKRQEAYNGVLVWNLAGVINILPTILLLALYLFGFYVHNSVFTVQNTIGEIVGYLLNVGGVFLLLTSISGAYISGCAFHSSISSLIRFILEKPQQLLKWILGESKWPRVLWVGAFTVFWAATSIVLGYFKLTPWHYLFFFTVGVAVVLFGQREVAHKPQKYKISHLALWVFVSISLFMAIPTFNLDIRATIPLIVVEALSIAFTIWMFLNMSKSMADTGEIDAIAWLLKTVPPHHPAEYFKKAGQMIGSNSIGRDYRPRLLESLMPFLSLLIISHPFPPEHPSSNTHSPPSSLNVDEDPHLKNLEIYIACLARSSEFTDKKGAFRCLWENAMQHPELENPLIEKLVKLANPRHGFPSQVGLRSAAKKVLNIYGLDIDMEGNPVRTRDPATSAVFTGSLSVATESTSLIPMSNINLNRQEEQGHPNLHRQVEPVTAV